MNEETLAHLRARVLHFFLAEAEQVGSLLALPEMQDANRRWVKRVVYALYLSGLLERWGATSGTTYRTSRLGFIMLVTLDEDLAHKPPGHDETDLY